ncbi:hypothetical protein ACFL1I_06680 [Candidatus Omnitrophota bacterium]
MPAIRKLFFAYLILLLAILAVIVGQPLAFQKSNAISEQAKAPKLTACAGGLDVQAFISSIPYRYGRQTIYQVEPAAKYKETIIEGRGNCSNLVFASAYFLTQTDTDFQIIHFLPRTQKGGFLKGAGHTVLRTRYLFNGEERVGIVDVSSAGLPYSADKFLDLADLESGEIANFSMLNLNPAMKHNRSSYYFGPLLSDSEIGWIPAGELRRYLDFIHAIYIPLGNVKIEKYIYDGLALISGFYPKIYVTSIPSLFDGYRLIRQFFIFSLWILRSAILLIPLSIIFEIKLLISRYRK